MPNTASQSATRCPNRDVLLAFYSGELPPPDIETVGTHLATCETCLEFLDSQNSGKIMISLSNVDSAKSSLLDDTAVLRIQQEPAFQRMAAQVKQFELSNDRDTIPWVRDNQPATTPAAEKHPEKIGPYFIAKHLGVGGFADVYKARDSDGSVVAIKVPRRDKLKSPTQVEDFLREAQTAAALDHPHIVPVHDFGRKADGSCYVVMKYIDGQSLESAMAAESMNWERIAEICAQIAGALDYAHNYDFANKKGLIHRDIKPANILLDKQGRAYIADFGLAIHEETQQDLEDEFAGTCAYMSPEQVRGVTRHLDARTDVWSLGVVMYELLTRKKPFPGNNNAVRMENILNHPLKKPRSINGKVPQELERICLGCLNKELDQRTVSAAKLATELRKWLWTVRFKRFALKASGWAAAIAVTVSLVWAGSFAVMEKGGGDDHPGPPRQGEIYGQPSTTIKRHPTRDERDSTKGAKPNNSATGKSDVAGEWESLFDVEPRIVFGHPGADFPPKFDLVEKSFSVNAKQRRWFASTRQSNARQLLLRSQMSVPNWLGKAGIAWGFRDEKGQYRWRTVEFSRLEAIEPCRLSVRELFLSGTSIIVHNNEIDSKIIDAPTDNRATLEIEIEAQLLRIRFNNESAWELKAPHEDVDAWLPVNSWSVGLTGDDCEAVFFDFCCLKAH